MIDTKTVMPRVARPRAGAFNFGISSGVEHKDHPSMKAIYLSSKSGPEGLVAEKFDDQTPRMTRCS
jgi:hypothetical protein